MQANVVVIGGGPAGLKAAALAASRSLKVTLVYRGNLGGRLPSLEWVEDHPKPGDRTGGAELAFQLASEASDAGVEFLEAEVVSVEAYSSSAVAVLSDGTTLNANVIVVATGSRNKYIPGIDHARYEGRGFVACASCDAVFHSGGRVAVIGGGHAGALDAMHLSIHAAEVLLVEKSAELGCSPALASAVRATSNIRMLTGTALEALEGRPELDAITLRRGDGTLVREAVTGLSLQVGHEPATGFLREAIALSPSGHIPVDHARRSEEPTVFAIGECRVDGPRSVAGALDDARSVVDTVVDAVGTTTFG